MVKRGWYFWKMIVSPVPDTDEEINSCMLGENPSTWRKCGDINGEARPKVEVLTTYVLDLDQLASLAIQPYTSDM